MDDGAQQQETDATPLPRRGWRRASTWVLIAGAFAVGVSVGLIVPWLMAPKTVAELRPSSEAGNPFPFNDSIDPSTLVHYEATELARAWTARNEHGVECLFVIVGGEWFRSSCAPGGLDPTVDVYVDDDGGEDMSGLLDIPQGSLVRVVLRDEVAEVWIAATPAHE